MYYCHTSKGYVSESTDKLLNNDESPFTKDINKAKIFDRLENISYPKELKDIDKEFVELYIPIDLKKFCMKEYLGNTQDKTKLDVFGRRYLTKFGEKVNWVTNCVKINLWEVNIEDKLGKGIYNGYWKMLIDEFFKDYYINIW